MNVFKGTLLTAKVSMSSYININNWSCHFVINIKSTSQSHTINVDILFLVLDSSCVQLLVQIERSFAKNVVRMYMPSVFVVIVGWLSFWIDRNEVSARIKLGTLCLLAMITEEVGIKFLLPERYSFVAIEVWFIVNLVFVVMAMIEYTFVHAVDRFQEKLKKGNAAAQQKHVVLLNVKDVDPVICTDFNSIDTAESKV